MPKIIRPEFNYAPIFILISLFWRTISPWANAPTQRYALLWNDFLKNKFSAIARKKTSSDAVLSPTHTHTSPYQIHKISTSNCSETCNQ